MGRARALRDVYGGKIKQGWQAALPALDALHGFADRYIHEQLHGVAEPGNCQLPRQCDSNIFSGSRGRVLGADFGLAGDVQLHLHHVDAIKSGRWKADGMLVPGFGDSAVELRDSVLTNGMLRTQLGWFSVRAVEGTKTARQAKAPRA